MILPVPVKGSSPLSSTQMYLGILYADRRSRRVSRSDSPSRFLPLLVTTAAATIVAPRVFSVPTTYASSTPSHERRADSTSLGVTFVPLLVLIRSPRRPVKVTQPSASIEPQSPVR